MQGFTTDFAEIMKVNEMGGMIKHPSERKMAKLISSTLKKVAEHPEEFMAPSIGKAREKFQALKQLFDELEPKLDNSDKLSRSYRSVMEELQDMEHNLKEAEDGHSLYYPTYKNDHIDDIIGSLAFC